MKFNSQICTTKEQSERLLALGLKKETADMVYKPHSHYPDSVINYCEATPMVEPLRKYIIADDIDFRYYTPAWSLHRLLYLIPNEYFTDVDFQNIMQRCIFATSTLYNDLIDLIEALIKEEYFYKEYLEE